MSRKSSRRCAAALLTLPHIFTHAHPQISNVVYSYAVANASSPNGLSIVISLTPVTPPAEHLLAWAIFNDTINETGWSQLEVHTPSHTHTNTHTDQEKAYAAGYLEGATTVQRSWEYVTNSFSDQSFENGLAEFLYSNFEWVKEQVRTHTQTGSDPYWHHVGLVYTQMEGLWDGYRAHASPAQQLDFLHFYASTLSGDLDDLNTVFNISRVSREGAGVRRGAQGTPKSDGHCSLLVKPIGDPAAPSELYISHTTWGGFEGMTRVYKLYDFPWTLDGTNGEVPARAIAFSSYAAALFSDDDFYTTSAGLAVSETTIGNNNPALWAYVKHTTVLEWARNMVANRLADSGRSWAETYSQYNSGTYNNEWHVLDYKKFQPGKPLADETLTVLDQFPGPYIVWADHTGYLRNQSYWASYNRVSSPYLFNISGQWELVKEYGDHFTYHNTSRALIFARQHTTVVDEASLRALMRYNDFQIDPLGTQGCANGGRSASNAIAERGDLTPKSSSCVPGLNFQNEGAVDCKYTTFKMMSSGKLTAMAQSGPTYDQQPPFVWSTSPLSYLSHIGLPDVWKFSWVEMSWNVTSR